MTTVPTRPENMGVSALVNGDFLPSQNGVAIAKRVKEIRRLLGPWDGKLLPRKQLGERIGVDEATIKRWEAGKLKRGLSIDNAQKLARLVEADVDWLLTGRGRPPKMGAADPAPADPAQPDDARQRIEDYGAGRFRAGWLSAIQSVRAALGAALDGVATPPVSAEARVQQVAAREQAKRGARKGRRQPA
jgi:transcriptional regulator with XRE-family HTH domain